MPYGDPIGLSLPIMQNYTEFSINAFSSEIKFHSNPGFS